MIIFSSVHIVFKERQISRGLSAILEVVLNINLSLKTYFVIEKWQDDKNRKKCKISDHDLLNDYGYQVTMIFGFCLNTSKWQDLQ